MTVLKIGDRIRDNDPRMNGRKVSIRKMNDTHVWVDFGVRVRADRIHTDGKPRRSGYDLLKENAE